MQDDERRNPPDDSLSGGVLRGVGQGRTSSVDIEGDINLGDTLGHGRDTEEIEVADELLFRTSLRSPVNLDFDSVMAVRGGRASFS